jgi:signal transduction histidine kinase
MVDAAYVSADEERRQLERSLGLASDELFERNLQLEGELEERKRLLVELQHAEKLRAVGQLAAGVAHEINTPIQFIGDSIDLMLEAFVDLAPILAAPRTAEPCADLAYLCDEMPRALRRCRDGAERVALIVRALKNFAHVDGVEHAPADVNAAIDTTLIMATNEVKYVADVELDLTCVGPVVCNVGEVQQVLLNLVINAAQAIGDRFATTGVRGHIRMATRIEGPDLVIAVSDDGAGLPDAARPRIFEPFFTTKPMGQGTGQGLALAHAIVVERHGGALTFESTVGLGTTFFVRLPLQGRVFG